jgi:hypothetical protein
MILEQEQRSSQKQIAQENGLKKLHHFAGRNKRPGKGIKAKLAENGNNKNNGQENHSRHVQKMIGRYVPFEPEQERQPKGKDDRESVEKNKNDLFVTIEKIDHPSL